LVDAQLYGLTTRSHNQMIKKKRDTSIDPTLLGYANIEVMWYSSSTVLISILPSRLAKLSIALLA